MDYVKAFLVGGGICAVCQIIYDNTKLTSAHILVGLAVLGAVLGGIGIYEPFVEWAGAGALIPVSGFGNSIVAGMLLEVKRLGWLGLFTGAFEVTGLGLASAIIFASGVALLFDPKH
ncbi:MAG: SpoVA/SpoVAEb family sporulation membrane protein [Firmicutes bacterium]|nr:SpoVA/SpoVAEb family sporulation membrane protein [Bacillota bacterium]